MKRGLISFVLFAVVTVRADLVMEQQFAATNGTTYARLQVRGDKMRMDQWDAHSNAFSVIIDLQTRDSYTLMPQRKTYRKRSGAEVQRLIQGRNPNDEIAKPPAAAVATGRVEKVGDRETAIYTWTGAEGRLFTLWLDTNYPDYENIRKDLARIDEFDATGPHPNAQPPVSRLPGMVVQSRMTALGKDVATATLISAKEEPLAATVFELPPDYTLWEPHASATTNALKSAVKP